MKILLFVLGLLTMAFFALCLPGIGDSAIRQGVAVMLWMGGLVALGSAAICERIDKATETRSYDSEQLRRLLVELRDDGRANARAATPHPMVNAAAADNAIDAILATRGLARPGN